MKRSTLISRTLCSTLSLQNAIVNRRSLSTSTPNYALSSNNIMNVFDRKAKLLQKERAAQNPDVKTYDYLKDEVGRNIADRIFDIKREFNNVLDLGCGRGHISKFIIGDNVKNLILADMCASYLDQAELPEETVKVQKMVLDEETFELEENSIDLVVSCLNLHWVNDLPRCFNNIIKCLRNDGVFIGAIFGGDTLYELRSSLQLAELERHGGISPHISPFTQIRDIGGLMGRAGFNMMTIDTDELVIGFPSMFEVIRDIKGMGENNASRNRPLHLKRDTIIAAAAVYDELYGLEKEDGTKYVPATFQIIYMLGWKPDASQPKPLERGTGQVSMKDLYKIDQIVRDTKKIKLDDDDNDKNR